MTLHKRPNERLLINIFVIMNMKFSDFSVKITNAPSLWSDPDVRSGNPSWGLWPPRWLWGSRQGREGRVPHGRSAKRLRVEVWSRWQRLRGTSAAVSPVALWLCCCYNWLEAAHSFTSCNSYIYNSTKTKSLKKKHEYILTTLSGIALVTFAYLIHSIDERVSQVL